MRLSLMLWGVLVTALVATVILAAIPQRGSSGTAVDRQVEELLQKMTLEEKVGQMTQLTLQAVSKTPKNAQSSHQLDMEKLRDALVNHHVGSLLNVFDAALTIDEWHRLVSTVQDVATKETRLGIPVIYGIDAVHGHNYMMGATLFPQSIGMAATWNADLVRREGEITAYEVRASGIPWNFSPVLDNGRQPLWSRFFETYGEDVYLASRLGAAYVEGQQGDDVGQADKVAACAKHFLGYGNPLSGKDRTPAWIPDRMLYEYVVPPFAAAIRAGVSTVMINSGEINGVPVHASRRILTQLLRHELGFKGLAVSDWEDIVRLHTVHRVASSPKEAVRQAVMAGIDMSMVPYNVEFARLLLELVRDGSVPESRVDEAVSRILRLKYQLGLFENPYPRPEMKSRVHSEEFQQASRQAAQESVTLLKNDGGLLPLSSQAKILVTGPAADSLPALHGSWTYTWQGTDAALYPQGLPVLRQSLAEKLGQARVSYVPGSGWEEEVDIQAAAQAAQQADVVLLCLGEKPSAEKPGDIEDLTLPEAQIRLSQAVQATGKPVVLVLLENRPRILRPIVEKSAAILLAYQPGPFGSEAIADVLRGEVNPSGRLPFTYPRHTGSIVPYDHKNAERADIHFGMNAFQPQFEFGHGLSYTSFEYSGLQLDRAEMAPDETLKVSVAVSNTGSRAGKEVVQLYVTDLYASITPPVRRLRGFEKIELRPGQSRSVEFELTGEDFSFIGRDNRPILEPGEFQVQIGGLKASLRVR